MKTRSEIDSELRTKIRTFGDPVLHTPCDDLRVGDDLEFLDTLRAVCRAFHNGAGLAAPQIGVLKRAAFIYHDRAHRRGYFILNPIVMPAPNAVEVIGNEGCLSFPGYQAKVKRFDRIEVSYFDEKWQAHKGTFTGFEAIVIQHETDHLNGICQVGDVWKSGREP